MNTYDLPDNTVVDGKGEPFREEAVMTEVSRVDACEELKGVNVREERVEEIIAESLTLSFIEEKAVN